MKTYVDKASDVKRIWHLVDVDGKILGQVAVQISKLLIGKYKTTYTPHMDGGDYVIVTNASKVAVTGKKLLDKMYYRHSGIPGGFKQEPLGEVLKKNPARVIEHAVEGMLPDNKLQAPRMARLKVFAGTEHPYKDKLAK